MAIVQFNLNPLDIIICVLWIIVVLMLAMYGSRYSRGTWVDYIQGGKRFPWWYLAVVVNGQRSGRDPIINMAWVAEKGLLWATPVVIPWGSFANYWVTKVLYRTGVITLHQWNDLRFGGKPGAFLRGYWALAYPFLFRAPQMGISSALMGKLLFTMIGINKLHWVVFQLYIGAFLLPMLAGIWGMTWSAFLQYPVLLAIWAVLGYFSWTNMGGLSGLIDAMRNKGELDKLQLFGWSTELPLVVFISRFLGWGFWPDMMYPEQSWQIFGSKSEDDVVVFNYFANPIFQMPANWVMFPLAFAGLALYPNLADYETIYGQLVTQFMPVGMLGLLLGAWITPELLTAQIPNIWEAGCFTNDFYRRLIAPGKTDRHYVWITRICMLMMASEALIFGVLVQSVTRVTLFLMLLWMPIPGIGEAHWVWWRYGGWLNLLIPWLSYPFSWLFTQIFGDLPIWQQTWLKTIVGFVFFIVLAFILPPSSDDCLMDFYRRTRPPGFWGHIRLKVEELERMGTPGL